MAGKSAVLSVRIVADAKQAAQGFREAEQQVDTFEGKVTSKLGASREQIDKVALASTAAAAAYGAFAYSAMQSASEMEQATGAVTAVFKEQADTVMANAEAAARAVGLSAAEYANSAAVMGSQLRNMGIEQDAVAGKTDELIGLGADLASMFGGTTADAVSAISSLLRGERDPIERYAVSIKQADINARLAAEGLAGLEGEALKQAETQATLALLFEQTADAQGNFARETDTAAGSAQIATAEWENAKAELGEGLLPIATKAAEILADVANVVGRHPELFLAAGAAIGAFTTAAVGISSAIRVVEGFSAAFKVANSVLAANPIGAVVTAVGALAAGLIYAYNESETFRNFVNALGRTALDVFSSMGNWINNYIISPIQTAWDWVDKLIRKLDNAWDNVKSFGGLFAHGPAPEVKGVFSGDVLTFMPSPDITAAFRPLPTLPSRPGVAAAVAPRQTINITINGVLNADDAAREIRKLIERDTLRRDVW